MRAEAILIQRPARSRPARNAFFALITFMAWLVWGVLWLPMITLVAWSAGLRNSYIELVVREHGKGWRIHSREHFVKDTVGGHFVKSAGAFFDRQSQFGPRPGM